MRLVPILLHKTVSLVSANPPNHSNDTVASPSPCRTPSPAVLALVLVCSLCLPGVSGFGTCRSSFRCLNRGVERYGSSIFSPCRCMCQEGYTGPRCQYREVGKKRSNSLSLLHQFLQARLRQESLRWRWQEEEQEEEDEEDKEGAFRAYDDDYDDDDDLQSLRRMRGSRRRDHPRFFRR